MLKCKFFIGRARILRAAPVEECKQHSKNKPQHCRQEMYVRESYHNRVQTKTMVCLPCGYAETFTQELLDEEVLELYREMAKNEG